MKTNMTYHARKERCSRIDYIIDTVGIGDVIASIATTDSLGRKGFQKLTNTGVIIVLSADEHTVVTTYIATLGQACAIYKTDKNCKFLPDGLYKKINNNAKYIKGQPKE